MRHTKKKTLPYVSEKQFWTAEKTTAITETERKPWYIKHSEHSEKGNRLSKNTIVSGERDHSPTKYLYTHLHKNLKR